MIPVLLRGELCVGLVLDEASEDGLLSLELAGLVPGRDPVENIWLLILNSSELWQMTDFIASVLPLLLA
jgi:hypothetical protein